MASSTARTARRRRLVGAAVAVCVLVLVACSSGSTSSSGASGKVLLVGSYHGKQGQYHTIQAAVDAAKPGDWVLVGPGDYHESDDLQHPPTAQQLKLGEVGGVLITTPDLHLRGMNRNTVVVDGTKPGSPECSANPADQRQGAPAADGKPMGRNGIDVFRVNDVWVENLTVCNFLAGQGGQGNGIWWDGGQGTAKIGLHGCWGSYLTATSTYYGPVSEDATYGILGDDAAGPATLDQIYASNFTDSGMYVGACQQVCGITIDHAWMEYNALGYSGTNSGGALVVENSQFDHNEDGFDTNTQILGDPPPPGRWGRG